MAFTLPDLPYAYDALAPHMSRETLEFHHDKHHQAYVTAGNNLAKGTEWENKPVEEVLKGTFGKNQALFNNAGQHYNHIHFWQWMKKGGGGDKLPGKLEKQITTDIGPIAKMKEDLVQAGVTQFGSGWCWLAVKDGKITVMKTPNGENPLVRQADPRLRRLGAFLLHRLSQPPPRLSQGLFRPPGQLGSRRRDVRSGHEIKASALRCV
jgi:superoxide dismutase, Fe-Mn family